MSRAVAIKKRGRSPVRDPQVDEGRVEQLAVEQIADHQVIRRAGQGGLEDERPVGNVGVRGSGGDRVRRAAGDVVLDQVDAPAQPARLAAASRPACVCQHRSADGARAGGEPLDRDVVTVAGADDRDASTFAQLWVDQRRQSQSRNGAQPARSVHLGARRCGRRLPRPRRRAEPLARASTRSARASVPRGLVLVGMAQVGARDVVVNARAAIVASRTRRSSGSPGSVRTVLNDCQVIRRITKVTIRPMIGSAILKPSATIAALTTTDRLTSPSVRAWYPSATSAGLCSRFPARSRT